MLFCEAVEKLVNKDPLIKSVTAIPSEISVNDTTTLTVIAEDPDGDILAFRWQSNGVGQFISDAGEEVRWIAPNFSGRFPIEVQVTDENGGKATDDVSVDVIGDESPIVTITQPVENEIIPGLGNYTIKVEVSFIRQIERVDLFIDNDSVHSDFTSPYEWNEWNVTALSGMKTVMVKAYDKRNLSNFGIDSVHVTIEGIVPIPKKSTIGGSR